MTPPDDQRPDRRLERHQRRAEGRPQLPQNAVEVGPPTVLTRHEHEPRQVECVAPFPHQRGPDADAVGRVDDDHCEISDRQRRVEFGPVGCAVGDPGHPQQPGARRQHAHGRIPHHTEAIGGLIGHPVAQPTQIVDHPDQGPAARGQANRPVLAIDVVGEQRVHRGVDLLGAGPPHQSVGQHLAHLGRVPAQVVVMARREQEQRGRHRDDDRDAPPQKAFRNGAGRCTHRQDERHQGGTPRRGHRGAEHPGEGDADAEDEHRRHGQPRDG